MDPFDLPWASSVYAKVVATNLYGDSQESDQGNNAIIYCIPDEPVNLAEDYSKRSASTLGLTWEDGQDPGGLPVIDYRITITQADLNFEQLVIGVLPKAYTATSLTFGYYYDFIVESRNSYGYSNHSESITMLCAWKPEPPDAPVTYVVGNQVYIEWEEPIRNGVPITGYRIYINQNDGVYTQESTSCDGHSSDVIANTICQVPLDTLIVAPYNKILNEEIWVKIIAENFYGDSLESQPGNNGLIKLIPDAPINIFNDAAVTDATNIKFTWTEGPSNGGMLVLDYDVYYDQGTGNWVSLAENVLETYYTTTVPLTPDVIYSFKVTARNSVGDSLMSESISIRAARVPDAPINLVNVPGQTTAFQIGLDWEEAPYNGGSPVLDYRISYKTISDTDWIVYKLNHTLTEIIVTSLTPGVQYNFRVESVNLVDYSPYSDVIVELAA